MTNDTDHPEPQWDDETWSLALSAMQRLEAAWRGPGLPNLDDFVPVSRDDPRFVAMLVRLIGTDRQCRCRVNLRKEPADYLAEWPELEGLAQFAAAFDDTVDRGTGFQPVSPRGLGFQPVSQSTGWKPVPQDAQPLQPFAFRIHCLHCHNPVEIIDQDPLVEMNCPSCGSSMSLIARGVPVDRSIAGQARIRRRIAHFELIEQLGVGAFGSVWKAKDTLLDTVVALKIPPAGSSMQTRRIGSSARPVPPRNYTMRTSWACRRLAATASCFTSSAS